MAGTVRWAGTAAGIGLAVGLLCATPVAAEPVFTAEDAAHMDWAFKNCGLITTNKEHVLADKALEAGGEAFRPAYEKAYAKIAASIATKNESSGLCDRIRSLYGKDGSRFADLLVPKGTSTADQPTSSGPKAAGDKGSGKRGGGKRGGGGGGGAPAGL
jgi:hypothetical protein